MNAKLSAVGLMIAVCGCAGADGVGPEEKGVGSAPDEQTGQITQPIFQGVAGDGIAVVGLMFRTEPCDLASGTCNVNDCTGAIVSSHVILTAGHCVTEAGWQAGSQNLFTGSVAVTYMDPRDRTFKCLTRTNGSTAGDCVFTDGDFRVMVGLVDPSFKSAVTDVRHDVAVIGNASLSWPGLDRTDAARIATGSTRNGVNGPAARTGDGFTASGFGFDGTPFSVGTLRFGPDLVRVDSVSGGVITNKASSVRMCKGDSGSPAMVYMSAGHPITIGVHSGSPSRTDSCATPGTQQTWAQTDTEIDFINQGLALFGTPCTNVGYILAQGLGVTVRECW